MNSFYLSWKNNSTVTTILIVVNILCIHWLSYGFFFRIDISKSGNLRITQSSKKILANLPSPITIEAYFSNDVPVSYLQTIKQMKDFLREYASYGNIRLLFIDPDKDPNFFLRAQDLGIEPIAVGSFDERKQEISNIYFSLALLYQDQQYILPNILSTGMLEYQLTSRIYKMIHPKARGIAVVADEKFSIFHEENPLQSLAGFNQLVSDFYGHLYPVSLEQEDIPTQYQSLLVVQPSQLSNQALLKIDQFLLKGNSVFFAVSGNQIDFQNYQSFPQKNSLHSLLAHYGFLIKDNILQEGNNLLPLRQQNASLQIQEFALPSWILLFAKQLSQHSSISKNLPAIFLPWASSLEVLPERLPYVDIQRKIQAKPQVIASTSKQAWSQTQRISIAPADQQMLYRQYQEGKISSLQSFSVAAYTEGFFESFFHNSLLPNEKPKNFLPQSIKKGKLFVITSPYALTDLGVNQEANSYLFLNVFDSFYNVTDLTEVRNVVRESPQLPVLSSWIKQTVTFLIFLFPLTLVSFYGLFHFARRKSFQSLEYVSLKSIKEKEIKADKEKK